MPVGELHRRVATIALEAAAVHGFALGGGNALLAHGVITRPTQDVDLFSDTQGAVEAAAGQVETALQAAGLVAERRGQFEDLADIFPGMGEGLAEWIITAPGGEQMMLQMAYFYRGREPVMMDIGPALDAPGQRLWLVADPWVTLHFSPTGCSWLNIESGRGG